MGLLKTAGRVAVASSVHGRVQRRQAQRWAAADQAAPAPLPAQPAPAQPAPVAPPAEDAISRKLTQLTQLGELRAAGILTEVEFEAKKALILAG